MSQSPSPQLTPLQETIIDVVRTYSGRFSLSGLAKLLVGAKSWRDTEHPEFGRLSGYGRKEVSFQVEILLQQSHLALDIDDHLIIQTQST